MKKKSIIAIMMLMTLSTAMFVGCNNNQSENKKAKVETSINNNTNNLKSDHESKQNEKEVSNNINEQKGKKEEKSNSKDLNKDAIKSKNTNENKNKKQDKSSNFTPQKAIEIAKSKYGTQKGNVLYSYKEEPYMSGDKKGYYIKLSSKTMIEQGGTGTLTWLLVTNDGKIIEDPRMD